MGIIYFINLYDTYTDANLTVSAQAEVMSVKGSELQMWMGDEKVCDADISVSMSIMMSGV